MRRRLFVQWVLACSAGEVFGFGLAAWTLGLLIASGSPDPLGQRLSVVVAVLSVGALEGTLLGALQWAVLRKLVPGLSANAWVGVTGLMALLGWLGGMSARVRNELREESERMNDVGGLPGTSDSL